MYVYDSRKNCVSGRCDILALLVLVRRVVLEFESSCLIRLAHPGCLTEGFGQQRSLFNYLLSGRCIFSFADLIISYAFKRSAKLNIHLPDSLYLLYRIPFY